MAGSSHQRADIEIGLNAAIVAVRETTPLILVVEGGSELDRLPSGAFDPIGHRTMEIGLRDWVKAQTDLNLGYVEQLYTFGDRGRKPHPDDAGPFAVSVGYLALTQVISDASRAGQSTKVGPVKWRDCYSYFPWEDWRKGRPPLLDSVIAPALDVWASEDDGLSPSSGRGFSRADRVEVWFGREGREWDDERVLERYELLYEAGLVAEAVNDGRPQRHYPGLPKDGFQLGRPMSQDHRRILATAIGRLRAKLKYRPVIFELLPETFTLFELQQTVESLLGLHLHKQNFRRQVESRGFVQETGRQSIQTGGRPAKLYSFRRAILHGRAASRLKI